MYRFITLALGLFIVSSCSGALAPQTSQAIAPTACTDYACMNSNLRMTDLDNHPISLSSHQAIEFSTSKSSVVSPQFVAVPSGLNLSLEPVNFNVQLKNVSNPIRICFWIFSSDSASNPVKELICSDPIPVVNNQISVMLSEQAVYKQTQTQMKAFSGNFEIELGMMPVSDSGDTGAATSIPLAFKSPSSVAELIFPPTAPRNAPNKHHPGAAGIQLSGSIAGFTGGGTLQLSADTETISLSQSSTFFRFANAKAVGSSFSVTVTSQPTNYYCVVTNGSGVLNGSTASNIQVDCYTLNVSISGYDSIPNSSFLIQNNLGIQDQVIAGATSYPFSTPLIQNGFPAYSVTLGDSSPRGYDCSLSNGSGTFSASNHAANVSISCSRIQPRIFVSASTYNGNLGALNTNASADAKCNADAGKPAGSRTYKALIVDGTNRVACTSASCVMSGLAEQVDWVLIPSTTYYRSDGTTVIGTTNSKGIFDFNLQNSFQVAGVNYWSGLSSNWTTSTDFTCSSWTSSSNSVPGRFGSAGGGTVNSDSINGGSVFCNLSCSLLCVEQ